MELQSSSPKLDNQGSTIMTTFRLMFVGVVAIALSLGGAIAADKVQPWPVPPPTISLRVEPPNGDALVYTNIPWSLRMTVLDAMQIAPGLKFRASWDPKLSGWYIEEIAGISVDPKKEYWQLCVEGYTAGVGASSYVLGPGMGAKWSVVPLTATPTDHC
jgi:hypothetical protein